MTRLRIHQSRRAELDGPAGTLAGRRSLPKGAALELGSRAGVDRELYRLSSSHGAKSPQTRRSPIPFCVVTC